ncbi:MAG: VTT domain-containing protein [Actinomycetota bacterium]|nr:VTT domain-containing protein [Actinomycetota bacterium]
MAGLIEDYGLLVLFAVIALQAAGGAGLPGKTALVLAAVLAADGRLPILGVLAVAAVAIIAGGAVGYAIGRIAGRRLVQRPFLKRHCERPLGLAEAFFETHGGKAVFFARFLPGLKVIAAPAAGICRMPVARFAVWHVAAAIAFALLFGVTAYYAGEAAIEVVERFGIYALAPLGVLVVAAWLVYRHFVAKDKTLLEILTGVEARQSA